MDETPLIYTCKGNIPIADTEYRYHWEDCADHTIFKEFWYLLSTGELVKNCVHVMAKKGLQLFAEQQTLPGSPAAPLPPAHPFIPLTPQEL